MTSPASDAPRRREWWTRPSVVLPVIGTIVLLVALLTPQPSLGRFGDPRLSSRLAGGLGARALAETAARFGFHVAERDTEPVPGPPAGTTIHAVLAPPLPVTPAEAHAYLEAVRGGDALLLVIEGRTPLTDSLGVAHTADGGELRIAPRDSAGCRAARDLAPPLWPDGRVHLYALRWLRGAPPDRIVFARLRTPVGSRGRQTDEAAAGFALGRGRVVVLPDPDLLRNDVLRRCGWGADALAMRMLEWLRAGGPAPRAALVFDEYHQGFGRSPSVVGVVGGFLVRHPVGRALLQILLAALVLLLAVGPRALVPEDSDTIERRDPLEQVDALAHAYEQVGASRTIVGRLLRGVRSRVEGASPASRLRPDEVFLAAAESADPALAPDVALIRRALREPVAARDLPEVGAALRRLQDSLTTTRA